MRLPSSSTIASGLLATATLSSAHPAFPLDVPSTFQPKSALTKRQDAAIPFLPKEITDYKTIITPRGVTIRYKEPGKSGVCKTTPDVNSYSGYIDLAEDVHVFFYFFESRRDPANDDLTLCRYDGRSDWAIAN